MIWFFIYASHGCDGQQLSKPSWSKTRDNWVGEKINVSMKSNIVTSSSQAATTALKNVWKKFIKKEFALWLSLSSAVMVLLTCFTYLWGNKKSNNYIKVKI